LSLEVYARLLRLALRLLHFTLRLLKLALGLLLCLLLCLLRLLCSLSLSGLHVLRECVYRLDGAVAHMHDRSLIALRVVVATKWKRHALPGPI